TGVQTGALPIYGRWPRGHPRVRVTAGAGRHGPAPVAEAHMVVGGGAGRPAGPPVGRPPVAAATAPGVIDRPEGGGLPAGTACSVLPRNPRGGPMPQAPQ